MQKNVKNVTAGAKLQQFPSETSSSGVEVLQIYQLIMS